MRHSIRAVFNDNGDDSTDMIAIIDSDGTSYRVSEKRDGKWCKAFWMPESELQSYETERVGELNSGQFMTLCKKIGVAAE